MLFCKYKDIFGKVNTGLHKIRILDIAIVDLLATIIFAYLISFFLPKYNIYHIVIFLLILSIFVHYLFCVKTTLTILFFNIN